MSTPQKSGYDYVDPFAGKTRLNQLSEKEVLLRNERMANPLLQQQYGNLPQNELDRLSREYYTGLAKVRTKEEQALADAVVPFGFDDRQNVSIPVDNIAAAAVDPSAPRLSAAPTTGAVPDRFQTAQSQAQQAEKAKILEMLNDAMAETKKLQYEVSDALKAVKVAKESGDAVDLEIAQEEYKMKREMFHHAQAKETNIMQLLGGR